MNLIDFQMKFTDEQACRNWLADKRWGENNAICPHCKSNNYCKHSSRDIYTCKDCKKQYTVRVGTVFEDSRLPLFKWFVAIYLFISMKKGISSIQLAKYIEITQKTAWFMLQKLKYLLVNVEKSKGEFKETTEIDEVYIGGSEKNRHVKDKNPSNWNGKS